MGQQVTQNSQKPKLKLKLEFQTKILFSICIYPGVLVLERLRVVVGEQKTHVFGMLFRVAARGPPSDLRPAVLEARPAGPEPPVGSHSSRGGAGYGFGRF